MWKTVLACAIISLIAIQPSKANPRHEVYGQFENAHLATLLADKPFDPQQLIGMGLDTVRMFFATIGRITEEVQGGETHLHAISSDSLVHGTRPSEVDAIVGPHGTRAFTLSFYKLTTEQMKKFTSHDFAGGKMLSFNGELEYTNMFAHVEMNAKTGMFSMACRAK